MKRYFCCDEPRRNAVKGLDDLNGIDFLEVLDDPQQPLDARQRFLRIHFINPLSIALTNDNIRIEGGHRIKNISVLAAAPFDADTIEVVLDKAGDFSIYTLRLIGGGEDQDPPAGIDPLLGSVDFSFKVNCPSGFDCRTARVCAGEPAAGTGIHYLAKDYASFRQLILDRLSVLVPDWEQRCPADTGIVLAELLAYAGDRLSYWQDAVATEAYIDTARRRVSVRRHVRLIDYRMHEGCNARVWVQICINGDGVKKKTDKVYVEKVEKGTPLLTRLPGAAVRLERLPSWGEIRSQNAEVFETMYPVTLYSNQNEMYFYTWGSRECCLPKGATRATLEGHYPDLKGGDVLVFMERISPLTGHESDADPTHRHAVQLVEVKTGMDDIGELFSEKPKRKAVKVTEIRWANDDALPFPLCISSTTDQSHGGEYKERVSVALGNIVLADHGLRLAPEDLGTVGAARPELSRVEPRGEDRCDGFIDVPAPPRYRPKLASRPITHAVPFDFQQRPGSAQASLLQDPRSALPDISLESVMKKSDDKPEPWVPVADLLSSGATAREFVVEIETGGEAALRFGDNRFGRRPDPGMSFLAAYRVGNGKQGNIGTGTLAHILSSASRIGAVWNPVPARGGTEPESLSEVREIAPHMVRQQERAVTADDYAEVARRYEGVQAAAATIRWTGSWHTVYLSVDRFGGLEVDDAFKSDLKRHVDRFRMAGHDVVIDDPHYVPLEVEMEVWVKPGYFRSDVRAALLQLFGSGFLPDGRRAVFHPDNFVFGQPVYLSKLYEAAESVEGVSFVKVTKFQRLGVAGEHPVIESKLVMGRLEIARLDNDPNYPDHGVFRLRLEGGT